MSDTSKLEPLGPRDVPIPDRKFREFWRETVIGWDANDEKDDVREWVSDRTSGGVTIEISNSTYSEESFRSYGLTDWASSIASARMETTSIEEVVMQILLAKAAEEGVDPEFSLDDQMFAPGGPNSAPVEVFGNINGKGVGVTIRGCDQSEIDVILDAIADPASVLLDPPSGFSVAPVPALPVVRWEFYAPSLLRTLIVDLWDVGLDLATTARQRATFEQTTIGGHRCFTSVTTTCDPDAWNLYLEVSDNRTLGVRHIDLALCRAIAEAFDFDELVDDITAAPRRLPFLGKRVQWERDQMLWWDPGHAMYISWDRVENASGNFVPFPEVDLERFDSESRIITKKGPFFVVVESSSRDETVERFVEIADRFDPAHPSPDVVDGLTYRGRAREYPAFWISVSFGVPWSVKDATSISVQVGPPGVDGAWWWRSHGEPVTFSDGTTGVRAGTSGAALHWRGSFVSVGGQGFQFEGDDVLQVINSLTTITMDGPPEAE